MNGSGFYLSGSWSPSESEIRRTNWNKTTEGYLVITAGKILRQISGQKTNALLGILPNGSFKYYESNPYTDVINDGVKDTITFGPLLINDGKSYKQQVGSERHDTSSSKRKALACIGQMDSNNFVIITTRVYSTYKNARELGLQLGCKLLYNVDGGGSTSLWFRNGSTGTGTAVYGGGRQVGDAIYFTTLK